MKNAVALVRELLQNRAVTIATTQASQPFMEGVPLDAITVIQLDGDVLNVFRDGADLSRHFAAVRHARARLTLLHACWLTAERGVFFSISAGAQLLAQRWAYDVVMQEGFGALFNALSVPANVFSSMFGLLVPVGLYASKWVVREALRRALVAAPVEAFGARSR